MSTNAPLLWSKPPDANSYYINSVACSANGSRVVGGTFFHSYSTTDDYATLSAMRRSAVPDTASSDDSGAFGTYCWDYQGNLLWSSVEPTYEGVYWVAVSADASVAASGGWFSGSPSYNGFIAAFDANTGTRLIDYYKTNSRVNQVALSANGSVLAAASNQLRVFVNTGSGFPTTPLFWPPASGDRVISCGVSADGRYVAAGTYAGMAVLLVIENGAIVQTQTWTPSSTNTVHSLALASDGTGFAMGMTNGEFRYFNCANFLSGGQPAWTQTLPNTTAVYGVGISGNASLVTAVGNIGSTGTVAAFRNNGVSATLAWQHELPANPNETSIDARGLWVATADGHPDGTPGHFTLFNAKSGEQVWQYTTGNMSWPIQLSADGSACAAGSDDGSVCFFAPLLLCEAGGTT